MPSREWNAMAWNSLCAPLPMSSMTRLSARAIRRAASAEVAAGRSAVVSVSEHADGGHREQSHRRVLRVAVHVLEGVEPPVGCRHELDHPGGRVRRVARGLVE